MLAQQAVFAIYAGINGLILLFLGIMVTRQRIKSSVPIMDAGKDEMIKAVRAHANAAEYIPMVLLTLVAMAWLKSPMWLMHIVGITLTVGRILHAAGLYQSLNPTALRIIGANLTWIALLIGSISALVYSFW